MKYLNLSHKNINYQAYYVSYSVNRYFFALKNYGLDAEQFCPKFVVDLR